MKIEGTSKPTDVCAELFLDVMGQAELNSDDLDYARWLATGAKGYALQEVFSTSRALEGLMMAVAADCERDGLAYDIEGQPDLRHWRNALRFAERVDAAIERLEYAENAAIDNLKRAEEEEEARKAKEQERAEWLSLSADERNGFRRERLTEFREKLDEANRMMRTDRVKFDEALAIIEADAEEHQKEWPEELLKGLREAREAHEEALQRLYRARHNHMAENYGSEAADEACGY